jgi:putative ABC transport system substrate-binding protein
MGLSAVGLVVTLTLVIFTPLAVDAQAPSQVSRLGILASGSLMSRHIPNFEAFRERLSDLGWVEGQNLTMEMRWAEGREERLPELAADLIRLKVDVIMTIGGAAPTQAAQHATSTIPIVMVGTGDPVGRGFVASLARPGGNITGNANVHEESCWETSGTPQGGGARAVSRRCPHEPYPTKPGTIAGGPNRGPRLRDGAVSAGGA